MNGSQIDIVLVYMGKKIPRYVFFNIQYLLKEFKNSRIIFVSDNSKAIKRVERYGATGFYYSLQNYELSEIQKNTMYDNNFRDFYWWKTSARIIAVCDVQIEFGRPVLHLESDVILFPEFPFSNLNYLEKGISFPLANSKQGVASMVYLRDREAARLLRQEFVAELIQNPSSSDMNILGNIASRSKSIVSILPTLPNTQNALSLFNSRTNDINHFEAMTSNYEILKGCVDGLQYGLYFLGEDPRNHRGTLKLFQNNYRSNLNLSKTKLKLEGKAIFVVHEEITFRLWSIHVHSKDLRAFNFALLRILLRYRSKLSLYGPRNVQTLIVSKYYYLLLKHYLKGAIYNR